MSSLVTEVRRNISGVLKWLFQDQITSTLLLNVTCRATSCDVMIPEAGGGCAGPGGDNDDDFTSDSSGSGLEIVCPCAHKITKLSI